MATRQKSFFDQESKQKPRHQWHRNRTTSDYPRSNNANVPAREVMSGPPINPSTQARKKLKAFQFIEGRPSLDTAEMEAEKENQPTQVQTVGPPKISLSQSETPRKSTEAPKLVHSKTCPPPSTPATRLPLADLVGNADATSRYVKPIASPDEQLCWENALSPSSSHTPAARRSKKRARSSSPVASSQPESVSKEPFNLHTMQETLKTPQADPAVDLWNRYTANASIKGTPSTKKGVAFAHLMDGSSPHSSATAGSVSGLRRWASCGLEFPVSAAKRRKIRGGFRMDRGEVGDVFGLPSSETVAHEPSKLETMIEKIKGTMSKPTGQEDQTDHPSSSSPLPDRGRFDADRSDSPLQKHGRATSEQLKVVEEEAAPGTIQPTNATQDEQQQLNQSFSSDEFGDADLDIDMVEAVENGSHTLQYPEQVSVEALSVEDSRPQLEAPGPPPVLIIAEPEREESFGSDDEFGFGDGDAFAADLELVASMYDVRPSSSPPKAPSPKKAQPSPKNTPPGGIPNAVREPPVIDLCDDSGDEFGDDDIDVEEFAAAEAVATQQALSASASGRPSAQDNRAIQRYLITRVDEGKYTNERGHVMPEKVLLVEEEKTKLYKAITLRQSWYDTPCTPQSFVHVIGEFSSTGQCLIDDANNMLILHPDHLISATVVADSFGCMRRAVLQDRVKATSRANAPMLYGTMLHELFQEALKANRWDTKWLHEAIEKILPTKYESILEIGYSCQQVSEHLKSKLPELQGWAEIFVRASPRPDAIVKERNGQQSIMSITKLLDVEEHVWSPQYGLKGNIDATVEVVMHDGCGERTLTVPFEVKTGRNSNAAHIAQTALYNLLLSDRYDVDVAYGILYYLESSDITRVPAIRKEIIHMIIKRNELACYVRERIDLPSMLKEDFKCQKCYAQEACFINHRLVEDGNGEVLNKKAKEKYDELVKHLKSSDQDFMQKWDSLLTKEESDMMKFRRELWTMLSTEREKLGRCFSNVILEPGSEAEHMDGSKINRYTYTFLKQKPKPGFSFLESQLIIGEPVVVSDEKGHFALANGYVTNVRKRRITIAVDRRLHNARTKLPGFHSQTNQAFTGIMEVSKEGMPPAASVQVDDEPVLYRLDKDEFSNGMAVPRNNLIQVMNDDVFKARELRSLIVDLKPPTFRPDASQPLLDTQAVQSMNSDQKAAIGKVMAAKDYALVLGMPGTGKTTTIAQIIRALVARGKSVLLTSYTHTAVDNILLKIRNDDIGILRLGAAAKVHPEVREFATLAVEPKDSLEELQRSWMEPPVVATTCLAIGHPLFNQRTFDYCIVDEASQITLPVCLGPIRMAKTFILVGDHHQLPPLVQNKEAATNGLDISLFMLLCEQHPQAVVSLEHQYRMSADIMLLSNTFIYSGRLKCGTEAVANRKLSIPNLPALSRHHRQPSTLRPTQPYPICPGPSSPRCWLSRALDPNSPVLFLNTDTISTSLETAVGSRVTNSLEARLITHLTTSLMAVGIPASDIGVIAFYRSQLALLRTSLQNAHTQTQSSELAAPHNQSQSAAVELHTADKFQGRDKEVILVSCVRSNENGVVGDLLKDRRRINVALTRARSKLVIVGSRKTLSENELLRDMIGLCEDRGWMLDLDADSVDGHAFEEGLTQLTGRSPEASRKAVGVGALSHASLSPVRRKALGDVTGGGAGNASRKKSSPKKAGGLRSRSPEKRFGIGKRGLLEGRPVLRDVFNGAM